uniref:Secreted protein n=1 Tax=Solanum tuberosum TaxID=4113 RepID=M1AJU2_SOLTU
MIDKQTRRIIVMIFLRLWLLRCWRGRGTNIKYLELLSSQQNCLTLHTTYSGNETKILESSENKLTCKQQIDRHQDIHPPPENRTAATQIFRGWT